MSIELIAELSTNHGGDIALAKEFIHAFAAAGATFVKFQHTRVKHLRKDDPQYAWFQQCEFTLDQFAELKEECERAGTTFLTTVYHAADVPEVASLGLQAVKIGSGEAREEGLASVVLGAKFARVFVGLGLCGNRPEASAIHLLANGEYGQIRIPQDVAYFGCCTRYPAPWGQAAECFAFRWPGRAMATSWMPAMVTGWSDHAIGLNECQVAILRGATIIETHVQLPRRQARDPKPFEKTVQEFRQLRAFADEDPAAKYIGRWQHGG